jgi:hypothetical protein
MPVARRCILGLAVTGLVLLGPACSEKTKNDIRDTASDLSSDAKSNGSQLKSDASSLSSSLSSDHDSNKSSDGNSGN